MNLIINLNKPTGITSQQAVTRVKRMLKVKKAGHTGTLDPLATGVMLVCLNEATKVSRFFLDMDKSYRARMKLGERTDTYDSEGSVIQTADISFLTEEGILDAVDGFRGPMEQVPPMYSAIKQSGRALYELARKGIEVERQSRPVTVYDISVDRIELPYVDLVVSCSKGTYIRSLCDDIGQKLGVWAHLVALERLSIGSFTIENAVSLEALQQRDPVPDGRSIFFLDEALADMPEILLDEEESKKARHGQRFSVSAGHQVLDGKPVKMKGPGGELFGIGSVISGLLHIERILNL